MAAFVGHGAQSSIPLAAVFCSSTMGEPKSSPDRVFPRYSRAELGVIIASAKEERSGGFRLMAVRAHESRPGGVAAVASVLAKISANSSICPGRGL
jgi:hypothetical protein